MPGDTLEVFGTEFTNVAGIKATDDNNQTKTYIRPQGAINISANGNNIDVAEYATANVSVTGTSKNAQTVQQSSTRISSSSYSKACGDITVSKTGTYHVYWTAYRTSSSGTWGTQLYIAGEAYGDAPETTFSSYYQAIHLTNVSLTANQTVAVYGRSRGSNYYLYVGQLTIIEA